MLDESRRDNPSLYKTGVLPHLIAKLIHNDAWLHFLVNESPSASPFPQRQHPLRKPDPCTPFWCVGADAKALAPRWTT